MSKLSTRISSRRSLLKILKPNAARFLSYCCLARALRDEYYVHRGLPAIIVVAVADGMAIADVAEAAQLFVRNGNYEVLHLPERIRRSRSWPSLGDTELADTLCKPRLLVVTEGIRSVPEAIMGAADSVVSLEGPTRRHVEAACRLVLGQTPDRASLDRIIQAPVPLIGAAVRRGRSVRQVLDRLDRLMAHRSKAHGSIATDDKVPTLNEMHGLGEAGCWGRDLAADLKAWADGALAWSDVDRGALVHGVPGTGKTTYAKALAKTCGVPLVLGSIARWQARGHLGDMLKAMRATFDEAKAKAPAILFLDEIDAVGDRERFDDHNAQYSTEVVAALLECIDGADAREGVVVIGACNCPDRIDRALIRSGRLDRTIEIPLPDSTSREGIMRWHLRGALANDSLSEVVERTHGWSGADLERIVREARRRARRERREMIVSDISASLPEMVDIPNDARWRAAIHEAGHAAVITEFGFNTVIAVAVATRVEPGKSTVAGSVRARPIVSCDRTRENYLADIAVLLGGIAAEDIFFGCRSDGAGGSPGTDLYLATVKATLMEASLGLGQGLVYLSSRDDGDLLAKLQTDRELRARVDAILAKQLEVARHIVGTHRGAIEHLAKRLIVRPLSGDEVREILSCQPRLRLITGKAAESKDVARKEAS